MTPLQAAILGIVQGFTEFLPISSSGHLVIFPYLMNWHLPEEGAFIFDVLVQVATLLAVIIFFRKDLWKIIVAFIQGLWNKQPFSTPEARTGWYLILATIPAGIVGLFFKESLEKNFSSPINAALCLLITAGLLILGEIAGKRNRSFVDITWVDALWIGVFQVISILPGVSRSGSTIAGGMTRNLDRQAATRFSFLMFIPAMLAAGLLAIIDLLSHPAPLSLFLSYTPGFITSAIVGYFSIRWLLSFLNKNRYLVFSIYCVIMSILTILVFYFRSH